MATDNAVVDLEIVTGEPIQKSDFGYPATNSSDSGCILEPKPPRKAQNGKLIPSLISMMITMVGLGIFGLPLAFAETGIIGGCALVIICGIATDAGLVALVRVQKMSGGECYEDVSQFYFGTIGLAIVYVLLNLDLVMAGAQMLTPFAQYSGETILRWSNCWNETQIVGNGTSVEAGGSICHGWNQYTIAIFPVIVIFPFLLKKTVDSLKWASFMSVLCLILSIVIFFHYYFSWEHCQGTPCDQYQNFFLPIHKTVSLWPPADALSFIDALGIVFYAYVCFFQILLLYSELANKKNIYPIIHGATLGFAMPLYIVVGIMGYCVFGEQLAVSGEAFMFQMMNDSYTPKHILIVSIGVTSVLKIPIFLNPVRDAALVLINNILQRCRCSRISDNMWYRIPMAGFLGILSYVMAQFIPLDKMLVYAGSLTGASLSGYIVGFLLLAYVSTYGLKIASPAPSSRLQKCGILSPRIFRTLSKKMKRSYIIAWLLICYGIGGTILGLTTPVARDFFGYEYEFTCQKNNLCT